MNGLWRPMATYGLAGVLLTSPLFLPVAQPLGLVQAAAVALTLVPLQVFLTLRAALPGTRFLAGLRDGGIRYTVAEDHVGWFGARRMRIVSAEGEWFLETENGREVSLRVRGPHLPRHAEFRGQWRRAGKLVARVNDTPWKRVA